MENKPNVPISFHNSNFIENSRRDSPKTAKYKEESRLSKIVGQSRLTLSLDVYYGPLFMNYGYFCLPLGCCSTKSLFCVLFSM